MTFSIRYLLLIGFNLLMLASVNTRASNAVDEFLDPELAFPMQAQTLDANTLEVRFTLADGYYLYQDKLHISADNGVELGAPVFPPALTHYDPFQHKDKAIYRQQLVLTLPVATLPATATDFTLTVKSQGCADAGLCYPPFKQTAVFDSAAFSPAPAPPRATPVQDESSRIHDQLQNGNLILTLLSFFGFGLLLAFTPCVFPMIPILSGIIVGQGQAISKKRALTLSVAYVLGMAVTYTAAGVAAGLSGTLLSAALQNVWVLGGFALVFVALSLSMFGFYELQLPASLQGKLSSTANQQQSGSIAGVSLMGALSALIVGPCVAAPLAGALLYIAQTKNAVLGGAALFSMALGMGAPLILVGVAARSALPKAGQWMEGVKKAFGVMLLGVAIWLVSPVVSPLFTMLALAALLIFSGVYLHALDPLPTTASGWQRFWKGAGVMSVLFGTLLVIGALAGSRDPLQPLAVLQSNGTNLVASENTHPRFERITSADVLNTRIASAEKPVLVDFYADWCVSCVEMERFTFPDPHVSGTLQQFTLLQVDITANTDEHKALLERFGLFGPPAIVLLDGKQQAAELNRAIGFQSAEALNRVLENVLENVSTL